MINLTNTNGKITITNSEKKSIIFDSKNKIIKIEDFDVNYPGEYEKSGILLEVKLYNEKLFYNFLIDGRHLVIINYDDFELKEEILSFFGDIDVLIIIGTKESAKIYESIEAKVVVPFGEAKDLFLNTLGQHIEEEESYKVKTELLSGDTTTFINLKENI